MAMLTAELPAVEEFLSEGLITEVLSIIKSGKEASAYLCRAHRSLGARFVVAKVYHERGRRNFANDAIYQEGRVILNGQVRRAVAKKTEIGRTFQSGMWVNHEYDQLCALYDAGTNVPEPFACADEALLLAYLGDATQAAPQLQSLSPAADEARQWRDTLLRDVETFLAHNVVHADLSAFNVLVWQGKPWVIDFPQAVDPRFSPHARRLLDRDLGNLARWFERHGAGFDAERTAESLWRRWESGRL